MSLRVGDRKLETLEVVRHDDIVVLTLDRPDSLNALNEVAFEEVPETFARIREDDSVRVLVLTGRGRGFCAGADVKEVLPQRAAPQRSATIPEPAGREWTIGLPDLQVPVVAAVNGPAAGAGFGIALMSDIRIAAESAFFVEAHVARGLTPSIAAWYLPRIVGLTMAMDLLLRERRVYAKEALEMGLVSQVVPDNELMDATMSVARELAAKPPFALRTAKAAVNQALDAPLLAIRQFAGAMEALSKLALTEARDGYENF